MSKHHPPSTGASEAIEPRLSGAERAAIEHRLESEPAVRGQLMALVEIRVYERGSVPRVAFPATSSVEPTVSDEEIATLLQEALACLEHRLDSLLESGAPRDGRRSRGRHPSGPRPPVRALGRHPSEGRPSWTRGGR